MMECFISWQTDIVADFMCITDAQISWKSSFVHFDVEEPI